VRWLIFAAAFLGVIAGLAFPSEGKAGPTGLLFQAWYHISSGTQGQSVKFLCDWHAGGCDSVPGDALDWDRSDSTADVYFRGAFKRSGASGFTLHLNQYTYPNPVCHEIVADVHENHLANVHGDHTPRWGMHFTHAQRDSPTQHYPSIYTTSGTWGFANYFKIGYMVAENPAICPWVGPRLHVHDHLWLGPYPVGLPGYDKRLGFFMVGQFYQNNIHWTRYTEWGEGGYQP